MDRYRLTNPQAMGRDYAGILGLTTFVTVMLRGLITQGTVESIVPVALAAMFLLAAVGWLIGTVAARIVDESVQQRLNAELAAMEAESRDSVSSSSSRGNAA